MDAIPDSSARLKPNLAAEPWVDPVIEAYKKDVDQSLIQEILRMTVEQRFDNLMALQEFAAELRRAGKAAAAAVPAVRQ